MAWNNNIQAPKWSGNAPTNPKVLNVSSIYTNYLQSSNLYSLNGSIPFLSNLVLNTGIIQLGVTPTTLTAIDGALFVDGNPVSIPTALSNIAEWARFPARANVNMNLSTIYNALAVSTITLNASNINSSNLTSSNINARNLTSSNIVFDTLNGRLGRIDTLIGSNVVYFNSVFDNSDINFLNSKKIYSQFDITTPGISTIFISSFLIEADTVASRGIAASNVEIKQSLDSKRNFLSSINANNISSGIINCGVGSFSTLNTISISTTRGLFSTLNVNTISTNTLVASNISNTVLNTQNINLIPAAFTPWDPTVVYQVNSLVNVGSNLYRAVRPSLNVAPNSSIPLWITNTPYQRFNYAFVAGVATYMCIADTPGSVFPPNTEGDFWSLSFITNFSGFIWTSVIGFTGSGITGDDYSYVDVGSVTADLITTSNITTSNITATNVSTTNIATSNLIASNITTSALNTSNLNATNISNTNLITRNVTLSTDLSAWNTTNIFLTGSRVSYGSNYYRAIRDNLNVVPISNIPFWSNGAPYQRFNYAFVEGLGTYVCISNTSGTATPPNGEPTIWNFAFISRVPTLVWVLENTFQTAAITGDQFSFLTIGTVNACNINVSSTTASNIYTSNIFSQNISNANNITTATLNASGNTVLNNLNTTGNTTLNTLTTSGQVYTQNILNVQGLLSLQSDLYGKTNPGIIEPYPEFLVNINNIKKINCESLDIYGGSTNDSIAGIPVPPYRNNTIVNIGTSGLAPAVVTIGGVNPFADTAALTVYGELAVEEGSFNSYYTANFYPLNLTLNAINAYGTCYLNGAVTITGFTDILGSFNAQGIATFLGAVNVGGLLTAEGELNVAGAITAEAGIGVVGFTQFQLGDIVIGDSGGGPTNNYNVYIYYNGLDIENITVNGNGDFRQNVNVDGTLTVNNLVINNGSFNSNTIQKLFVSSITGYSNRNVEFTNSVNFNAPVYIKESEYNPQLIFENSNALQGTITLSSEYFSIEGENVGIAGNSNVVITAGSNVILASINPISVYSRLLLKEFPEGSSNYPTLLFENSNATKTGSIEFNTEDETLVASSSGAIYLSGVAGAGLYSELGPVVAVSLSNTASLSGTDVNVFATDGDMTISANGGLLSQIVGNIDIQGFSNINIATFNSNTSSFDTGLQFTVDNVILRAQSNMAITSATGYMNINSLGTLNLSSSNNSVNITTTDLNPINISASGGGNVILGSSSNTTIAIGNSESISLEANNYFKVLRGSATTSVENNIDYISYAGDIILGAPSGKVRVNSSNLNVLGSISTIGISTGTFFAGDITTSNIIASNITTPALSTTIISTATIFTNALNAPVNINIGKSLIPFSATNLDLGAQGFNFRQLFISSIRCVSSIITSTITTDRLLPTFDSGVRTGNLYPQSFGSQIGFGPLLASGGFYNIGNFRSTITTNLSPATDGATTSNNIKVMGHLSTMSLGVSTINFKQYPFISTLSNSIVTTTATTTSGTPGLTRLQSNALRFPFPGTYNITQKYSISKGSGGGTHGCLIYDSNAATTTTVANANNWSRMGMASVPFHDQAGVSTFTTAVTTILANSANLTRDLYYYDSGSGNYTASFYITPPTIEYIPRPGILPEV